MKTFLFALLFASIGPRLFAGDDHNPIGVTGAFEGVITTGGAYNVLNHNATRQIDDIVMPGAIGKYGLKMTRYYNSRRTNYGGPMGPGWTHEYMWGSSNDKIDYPNGNAWDSHCTDDWGLPGPRGVSDWPTSWNNHPAFRLADGGMVVFGNPNWPGFASQIIDPYGQTTSLTYDNSGALTRVTEPAGRYLQFTYSQIGGSQMLTEVDAYDGQGNRTDYVIYSYASKPTGGSGPSRMCLSQVDYSDGTQAKYTYTTDNQPEHPNKPCPCTIKLLPLVIGCDDVRYHGPMRRIAYEYQAGGPHGAILREKYWDGTSGNEGSGVMVSRIDPPAPSPLVQSPAFDTHYTEYRGDGPTRTFNYTTLHLDRVSGEGETCPIWNQSVDPAPSQFLLSYTDFKGNTTYLGYDTNWYVNSVRDANNHTTTYIRGPSPPDGIGEVLTITHPDPSGSHIDYTYDDHGHYVHSISNERQKVTTYTRDPNTPYPTAHLVTRIDYPSDADTPASSEVFTYNSFGQVLTHRLKNNAWESFVYDNRGLLTDKYNPKATLPSAGDPHTHYTYYTSGPWTDRVMTMTLPGNYPNNLQASETYEYDRALGADGTTDPTGTPVAGRGLVTKITHGDNTYQRFKYDAYGNKRWEDNELRQASSYTYDDYNRLLTATDPLLKTTSYTYTPTNGGGGSSYKHTTSNPDTVTTPAGIVTSNVYDPNFRKTSSTVSTSTTWFHYDAVGNQDYVTDPRGTSSPGIYTTYTDYDSRNRKWQVRGPLSHTTQFYYDDNINITRIIRAVGTPDVTTETKVYDALNRVTWDTVPQTNSLNLVTYFNYNPSGTIAWMSDPNGHYTSFYYDASDQRIEMVYHDGSTQWWGYDDAHNLKYRITVNGEWQLFSYDIRNRKYANWWSNWNDSVRNPDWCYFAYDPAGRLTEAENGTNGWGANIISDVHRSYDAAGHLTLDQQIVTGLGTKNVQYPSYDDDGRLTRMYVSGASGYDFTYSYDAMGRFEKIFLTNSSQLFQYHYDAASNETQRDNLLNGVNQVYPRDALNRMQYMDVKKGATTLNHELYTYDGMDRITVVTYGTGPADSFTYYLDGELNAATLGNLGHNLTYNLDKAGNRTSVVDNNVTSTYSPNTINQYYPTAAGSSVVNGSEHEISAFNGVSYVYINDERLRSASTGSTIYSMTYDALGRCMKRTLSSGPTTYYIYDGDKPIIEYDGNGTSVGVNVYGKGVDEILERVAAGAVYYPQQNHEGSVTLLTNASGSAIERYRYDAFGAPTFYTGTWGARSNTIYDNRFLFTGREYAATYRSTYNTPAFNFYEYRARAYSPQLGRFMSEDSKLFDAGDYNLFRYCHNDPIDFTDPMGLEETLPPGPNHASPLIEQSKRQMRFDRSNGAIREVANRIAEWAQQAWKRLNPPPPPGVKMGTVIAAAPIEEAPAALASLGRLISKTLRASEAETTSTALSTIRVTRPGESFYRYETANPAFSRITESGGVTPKTFAAPTSDGVVPLHLRGSAYKLPNPEIPRPVVRSLSPPPGTAIIGPRSVIEGTKNEVMFPFGY